MRFHGSFALKLYLCLVAVAPAAAPGTLPSLSANPPAVDFEYTPPQAEPQPVLVTVTASDGSTPAIAVSLMPANGTPATLFPQPSVNGLTFQVGIDINTLNSLLNHPGIYSATITVTAAGFNSLTVNVTLSIGGTLSISAAPASLSFTAPAGPAVQTIDLSGPNGAAVGFTAATTTTTGGFWLSVTANADVTPAILTVTVSALSLPGGAYSGSITVTPTNVPGSLVIPVTLQVTSNTLTVSPSSLAFAYTSGGTTPPAQILQLTDTISNNTYTAQASSTGNWLLVNGVTSSVSGPLPANLNVTVNPAAMAPGTYQGTITVTDAHANTENVTVMLYVTGISNVANPPVLTFVAQIGGPAPAAQTVYINGAQNGSFTASVTAKWLAVSPASGPAPAQVTVTANPAGLAAGSYSGYVMIDTAVNVDVTLVVSANPVLTTNSGDLFFNYFGGNPPPPSMTLDVNVSSGPPQEFTVAPGVPSWLQIGTAGVPPTTPSFVTVTVAPQSLAAGDYVAQVILLPSQGGPPVTVPVLVQVTGATAIVPSVASLTFSGAAGSSPQTQTIQVTASSSTSYTAAASTISGGNWLSVSPTKGTASLANTPLSVTADATHLAEGAYQGHITLTTSGGVVTLVSVTFNVGAVSVPFTISPSTLAFAYTQNGTAPAAQAVQITGSESFTASAGTSSGGAWLAVTPMTGTGDTSLSVSVDPSGLAAGSYKGTITVTPAVSAAQTVAVTLTVTASATLSATPLPLAFAYTVGNAAPAAQTVSVSSSGAPISFTAAASSSGWLSVTPAGATTPATLSVSVNPANLGAGSYTGSITLSAGSGALQLNIAVTLTVVAPQPVIDSLVNAASYLGGGVAPGEIVTVFGTSLGPSPGVSAKVDSQGFIETSVANVQVMFNGYAAPILYAGSGQINCIVPYELAGGLAAASNASVEVIFGSAKSNAVTLPVASSAPGIFSADASGKGPGAILDLNYHLVSSSNPVSAGSTIQVFATGQGQTNPAGKDGLIEPAVLPLPAPQLAAGAVIGGVPATIEYIGAAPGLVAGALQINIVVPKGVPGGPSQLILSIGGNSSQNGITVAIE